MDIKEIIEGVARHYDTSVSDIRASSRDDKTFTANSYMKNPIRGGKYSPAR